MSILRLMLFVAPAAKDAVDQAALAGGLIEQDCIDYCTANGLPIELGLVAYSSEPSDPTLDPPVVPTPEYYYAGWQEEEAKMLRAVEVLSGIPGVEIFRGTAEGVEDKTTEIDDDTIEPTLLHRMSARAAHVIGSARVMAAQSELEMAALNAAIDEAERMAAEAARRAEAEEEAARLAAEEEERLALEALLRIEAETELPPEPGATDPSDLENISL